MTRPRSSDCSCERDVLDLVAMGQWPSRADQKLRDHVAGCPTCAEVASVASAVREWAEEPAPVKVPDASVVWYLAQVRAREEATRKASRPVLAAQAAALVAVFFAGAWIGPEISLSLSDLTAWWPGWPEWPALSELSLTNLTSGLSLPGWLGWAALGAIGTWILVGSLAYLLTDSE